MSLGVEFTSPMCECAARHTTTLTSACRCVNYSDPFGLDPCKVRGNCTQTQEGFDRAQLHTLNIAGHEEEEGLVDEMPSAVGFALAVTAPEGRAAAEGFTMLEGPARSGGQVILQEFFGHSAAGAEARLASRTITPGVTKELLEDYAAKYARPIVNGAAPLAKRTATAVATQTARLRLIGEALKHWPAP
jgi:hypothetical protein